MEYDIGWVISNTHFTGNETKFLEAIEKFLKKKKSLMLWGDNDPYHYHQNLILKKYFDGMYMQGNYYGG